jgi:hypothetical protein
MGSSSSKQQQQQQHEGSSAAHHLSGRPWYSNQGLSAAMPPGTLGSTCCGRSGQGRSSALHARPRGFVAEQLACTWRQRMQRTGGAPDLEVRQGLVRQHRQVPLPGQQELQEGRVFGVRG